jgi:hypothetical protein
MTGFSVWPVSGRSIWVGALNDSAYVAFVRVTKTWSS